LVIWRQRTVSALSTSRAVTSLIFLQLVLSDAPAWSLMVLVLIELSDLVDGKLARRWKVASPLGYILDAFGDRTAYVAYALAAMTRANLSPLLAYAIIVRDFALFASRAYFTRWSTFVEGDRLWTKLNGIRARVMLWCFLATWYDSSLQWNIVSHVRAATIAILHVATIVYLVFSYFALLLLIQRYRNRSR